MCAHPDGQWTGVPSYTSPLCVSVIWHMCSLNSAPPPYHRKLQSSICGSLMAQYTQIQNIHCEDPCYAAKQTQLSTLSAIILIFLLPPIKFHGELSHWVEMTLENTVNFYHGPTTEEPSKSGGTTMISVFVWSRVEDSITLWQTHAALHSRFI